MCLNRCKLQILHKLLRRFASSLDLKGYDTASAVWQILLCKFIILVALQSRIIDPGYFFMGFQEFCNRLCIGTMPFHTQWKGFQSHI